MSDNRHLTSDVWYQTADIKRLTSDIWNQTSENPHLIQIFKVRRLKSDVWHQTSHIRHLKSEVWEETPDIRRLITEPDIRHLISNTWNQTSQLRHMKSDIWEQTPDIKIVSWEHYKWRFRASKFQIFWGNMHAPIPPLRLATLSLTWFICDWKISQPYTPKRLDSLQITSVYNFKTNKFIIQYRSKVSYQSCLVSCETRITSCAMWFSSRTTRMA